MTGAKSSRISINGTRPVSSRGLVVQYQYHRLFANSMPCCAVELRLHCSANYPLSFHTFPIFLPMSEIRRARRGAKENDALVVSYALPSLLRRPLPLLSPSFS